MEINEEKILAVYEEARVNNDEKTIEAFEKVFGKNYFKEKPPTYWDVEKELFKDVHYYPNMDGEICCVLGEYGVHKPNNATSKEQIQRLFAINMLMNVSVYLNKGWKPDWDDADQRKWTIRLEHENGELLVTDHGKVENGITYFKDKETAQKAIEILGKGAVSNAISSSWLHTQFKKP